MVSIQEMLIGNVKEETEEKIDIGILGILEVECRGPHVGEL